jgi:hypothetical protein
VVEGEARQADYCVPSKLFHVSSFRSCLLPIPAQRACEDNADDSDVEISRDTAGGRS